MNALKALAVFAAFVAFGPCEPADPSGAGGIAPPIHPPKAFPLGEFGMCIDDGFARNGQIIYRRLQCERGTVLVPMRYAPTPDPHKIKKPQLEAQR
jgi:hypothetical protein